MAKTITTDHLDAAVQELARHFNKSLATLREHMGGEFAEVHTKLDAIMAVKFSSPANNLSGCFSACGRGASK